MCAMANGNNARQLASDHCYVVVKFRSGDVALDARRLEGQEKGVCA